MSEIILKTVTGNALAQYIDELARLRIEVFRAFPYLYDGSTEYERQYLQTYLRCPDAAVVLALDGERVVGASSCLPLRDEDAAFRQPFEEHAEQFGPGFDPDRLFYCAESVLDARYRGRGIGVGFFEQREAHALQLGGFTHACFCAVERPEDHPLRPADYVPLDHFWNKRGYHKLPQIQTRFSWKDINQQHSSEKTMIFWIKELPA
ncbi:MAG: GNAT family N-acetyltransferase [Thiolinea sp.]